MRLAREVYGKCRMRLTRSCRDYYAAISSGKSEVHWRKAAEGCLAKGYAIRPYVEWRFHAEFPLYPMPFKFALKTSFDRYEAEGRPDVQHVQASRALALARHQLKLLLDQGEDLVEALLLPVHCFEPLFVYTSAKAHGREGELPADILEKARVQAFCNPVYADRFAASLPAEILEGGSPCR